ncbi:MAG: histidinol-phosphate transaminase [Clostridia bacterium]|nr:histidinol-phosphate transaminase [Clostridia bacterium]
MSKFLSQKYFTLEEYVPGEQPRDKKYIKLNTNESPYPPSPGVIEAINSDAVRDLRLYSDPESRLLKTTIAENYGVSFENVYVANGSDDILNFAFMAYGDKGVVYPAISYGFYSVFAKLNGITPEEIPLEKDFSIDIRKYFNKNKLICIANPNAPTGITLSLQEIRQILDTNPDNIVLIDEAYVDFGGESALPLIQEYNNLLVVQTFSKSRSMAGARLGFAFGNKEIIADLEKLKYSTNPYNINRLTQIAGVKAIEENSYYMDNCKEIIETREFTVSALKEMGFYVTNSKANFIFAKSDKISGESLYIKLKEKGILVRHFSKKEITDFNRITIGSKEEMESLVKAIGDILKQGEKSK